MVSHPDREIPVGAIISFFYIPMLRGFSGLEVLSYSGFPYELLQSPIFGVW
jgi:hypothetical protein